MACGPLGINAPTHVDRASKSVRKLSFKRLFRAPPARHERRRQGFAISTGPHVKTKHPATLETGAAGRPVRRLAVKASKRDQERLRRVDQEELVQKEQQTCRLATWVSALRTAKMCSGPAGEPAISLVAEGLRARR